MASDVQIAISAEDKASAVLSSVMNKVGGLASSFAAAGPMIAGIGAVVAGAAAGFMAVGASVSSVMSAADNIDALSDKARALGESVGSLQEFQFALAEAGNVDASQAVSTIEKLSATVGKIATGENKEGLEVFQKLGLDAQQLSLEGPIAQFEAIQNKLSEIGNNSERAAVAQKLFGKAAVELLPALSTQSDSMRESMEYARQVGAAVGDDAAGAVASMNDAIGRVQLGFSGLASTVAVNIAPAVEQVATYIATWLPPAVELANKILPSIIDGMAYVADSALQTAQAFGLMSGNTSWTDAIAAARESAIANADALEKQRELMRGLSVTPPEVDSKAFDSVIATLERQLEVAMKGEDAVKAQEQLLAGRNDQERERIRLMQEQVRMHLSINDAITEMEAEQKKAEQDKLAMQQKIAAMPKSTSAFESRVMSRGITQDPQIAELKKLQDQGQKQIDKLEQIYQEQKKRGQFLEVQVVQ